LFCLDHLDFIQRNSESAIVRRRINKPYDDVDTLVEGSFYKDNNCNGYSVSADAKFAFCRYNYTKVRKTKHFLKVTFRIEANVQIGLSHFLLQAF